MVLSRSEKIESYLLCSPAGTARMIFTRFDVFSVDLLLRYIDFEHELELTVRRTAPLMFCS